MKNYAGLKHKKVINKLDDALKFSPIKVWDKIFPQFSRIGRNLRNLTLDGVYRNEQKN